MTYWREVPEHADHRSTDKRNLCSFESTAIWILTRLIHQIVRRPFRNRWIEREWKQKQITNIIQFRTMRLYYIFVEKYKSIYIDACAFRLRNWGSKRWCVRRYSIWILYSNFELNKIHFNMNCWRYYIVYRVYIATNECLKENLA